MRRVSKVNRKTLQAMVHNAPGIISERTLCGKRIGTMRQLWFELSYTSHRDAPVTCEKCKQLRGNNHGWGGRLGIRTSRHRAE